ncbi:MAG: tetratricopeptide repeat protein [Paracoccaceae bacterium]
MRLALLLLLLMPTGVFATTCPPVPDRSEEKAALFKALALSADPQTARAAADELWRIWMTAPDRNAQAMLNHGMGLRKGFDFEGSVAVLNELVAYCPDYAEGWNQRAFSRYLGGDFKGAIEDIDRTLEIEPDHFGALSGKVLSLNRIGQSDLAQAVLRRALKVHPWLNERGALLPEKGDKL